MTVFEREATIRWLTSPPDGTPRMTVGSRTLPAIPLGVDIEAEHPLLTSPGELLAGAVGAIVSWLLAEELLREGNRAHELTTEVSLTVSGEAHVEDPSLNLQGIACKVAGRVPQINAEQLDERARGAMTRALETLHMQSDDVQVTVETVLEGA